MIIIDLDPIEPLIHVTIPSRAHPIYVAHLTCVEASQLSQEFSMKAEELMERVLDRFIDQITPKAFEPKDSLPEGKS